MPDRFVTIASYSSPLEANLARAALEAFDIDAILKDLNIVGLNWSWASAFGGIKVQVLEPAVAEALRILAAEPADETSHAVACPNCTSTNTRFLLDKRGACLTWLLLGFPAIPAFARQECGDCGNRWKIDDARG